MLVAAGCMVVPIVSVLSLKAAPNDCDDVTPGSGAGDDRYRWRENRCEGLYNPFVSTSLRAHSFSLGPIGLPVTSGKLGIRWAPPSPPAKLSVLVESMNLATPYRLRANVDPDRRTYEWPKDIALRRGVSSLAVLVQTTDAQPVSTPACSAGSAGGTSSYLVTFQSTKKLPYAMIKLVTETDDEVWNSGWMPTADDNVTAVVPATVFRGAGSYKFTVVGDGATAFVRFRHPSAPCLP
jgi:hypothetical protein